MAPFTNLSINNKQNIPLPTWVCLLDGNSLYGHISPFRLTISRCFFMQLQQFNPLVNSSFTSHVFSQTPPARIVAMTCVSISKQAIKSHIIRRPCKQRHTGQSKVKECIHPPIHVSISLPLSHPPSFSKK
jgi:hypothetical protein